MKFSFFEEFKKMTENYYGMKNDKFWWYPEGAQIKHTVFYQIEP